MDDVHYTEYELQLTPGADVFVYSDGLPEGVNEKNEQFGTDRIVRVLNETDSSDPETLIREMDRAMQEFAAGTPQFDDLTMLSIHYNGQSST